MKKSRKYIRWCQRPQYDRSRLMVRHTERLDREMAESIRGYLRAVNGESVNPFDDTVFPYTGGRAVIVGHPRGFS